MSAEPAPPAERQPCRASVRIGCPDSPVTLACHQPTPHPGLNHYDGGERIYWQRTDSEPWLLASPPPRRTPRHTGDYDRNAELARIEREMDDAFRGPAAVTPPEKRTTMTGTTTTCGCAQDPRGNDCRNAADGDDGLCSWCRRAGHAPAAVAGRDAGNVRVTAFTTPEDGPYMTLDEVHQMAADVAGRDTGNGGTP